MAAPVTSPAAGEPRSAPGCPSDNDLLSFIPGLLADEDAAVVLAHLQSCPTCQSRVTTLKKRISTGGGVSGSSDPAPTTDGGGQPRAALSHVGHARLADPSDPTLDSTAYSPKRQFPKQLGHYQLLRMIGHGGMGMVFKAYHPRLQRYVAIKLLPGLHLSDQTAIIRLQRETAAAGRVEHENIVYAFDAGEQDGIDYLVMEFVEGVDLARLVAACEPLAVADACEIVRQAALGLAHVEACGLVHRDIKPSNLMLSREGIVKILDLGLARLREGPIDEAEATHSGFLLGTADYIAPEQIDTPRLADVRSDLYSLGCAMFKLLAGRAPFSDEKHSSVNQRIDAHRHEPPPSIRTLRPDVPEALEALLLRMLAKDPAKRPQHPPEVAAALAPLAEGANLPELARRAGVSNEIELPHEQGSASQTPATVDGSTHPQGRTPTPRVLAMQPGSASDRRLATAAGIVIAMALIVIGGAWAWSAGLFGESSAINPAGDEPESNVILVGAEPLTFDLRREYPEKIWPGYYKSSVKPAYDEEARMLEVRSDSFRLIELGNYDGTPGTFEATIRQVPWRGESGLFFGYRIEPKLNKPRIATFQLFSLVYLDRFDEKLVLAGKELSLFRHRGMINTSPAQFAEEFSIGQVLTNAENHEIHIRIEFGDAGCRAILVNGQDLKKLASEHVNRAFENVDYAGSWGLYDAIGYGESGPTWFGDIRYTPTNLK